MQTATSTTGSGGGVVDPAVSALTTSSRVEREETMFEGRWLRLKRIIYSCGGTTRGWETLERSTKGTAEVDCVEVVAVLKKEGTPPSLILNAQFRPPVGGVVLELPSGMLDKGETADVAGLRELKEETGYVGRVVNQSSSPVFFGCAISNTTSKVVVVEVDGNSVENEHPTQHLEETEDVKTVIVPIPNLLTFMDRWSKSGGLVDGKVWMLSAGILMPSIFH
ncbi:ADP-sugar pyrophosphatase [Pelomyxa schiedti]|nr:ADP-sugar pyrophosphatase [Pelomyxa schiedti]